MRLHTPSSEPPLQVCARKKGGHGDQDTENMPQHAQLSIISELPTRGLDRHNENDMITRVREKGKEREAAKGPDVI